MSVPHYGRHVHLDKDACKEVVFWKNHFAAPPSFPIWPVGAKVEILSFSDASDVAWGGHAQINQDEVQAHGNWIESEQGHRRSSTWRELKAVYYFLQSVASVFHGRNVCHHTDNQNVERIMMNGSRVESLHTEAVAIYDLCMRHRIRLTVTWIPREENGQADYLSKVICKDDYKLDPQVFHRLDDCWGPHSVDVFASHLSAQLPRFFSQFWCPGTSGVDAFALSWAGENNWLFPPPYQVSRVLAHMEEGQEDGTLVVPLWQSQRWWPRIAPENNSPAEFVVDWCDLQVHKGMFKACGRVENCFTDGTLASRVLALRICFCKGCRSKCEGVSFGNRRTLQR